MKEGKMMGKIETNDVDCTFVDFFILYKSSTTQKEKTSPEIRFRGCLRRLLPIPCNTVRLSCTQGLVLVGMKRVGDGKSETCWPECFTSRPSPRRSPPLFYAQRVKNSGGVRLQAQHMREPQKASHVPSSP